jgi:hypothetical protein
MPKPAITKTTAGTRITVTDKHGNEMTSTMTDIEAAAFAYDFLTKALPNNHLTQILRGKAQG